jgi:SAM-dependent methyltransferase
MPENDISKIIELLRCPVSGDKLALQGQNLVGKTRSDITYPIKNGVIDFVGKSSDYDSHWTEFSVLEPSRVKLDQAKEFLSWVDEHVGYRCHPHGVVVDIGCGDGNHLSFLPPSWIKIAIDYSTSVEIVRKRYAHLDNLFVIRADASCLPIRDVAVDLVISYGCMNCMPIPQNGVDEATRVLRDSGAVALWGYGTRSILVFMGIRGVRLMAKVMKPFKLDIFLAYLLVPCLYFFPSNTGISLKTNSVKECLEIVSTNLSPNDVHILYSWSWRDIVPKSLVHLAEFKNYCGQLFVKRKIES